MVKKKEKKNKKKEQKKRRKMSLLARPEVAVAAPLTGSLQVGFQMNHNFLFSSSEIIRDLTVFFKYDKKSKKKINIS